MSCSEYVKQLEQVNLALESCSNEDREELLSLKNSLEELLALTVGDDSNLTELHDRPNENIDDEYALFMAEINDVSQADICVSKKAEESVPSSLQEMEGKMCKAPHKNKWGSEGYHNAMICSVIPSSSGSVTQVRVLFVNPIHEEMLPCPYYFETDCKFTEEKCKYSHGEIVPLCDLQDFIEPDFASLQIGSLVLAQQNNKLWGRAKITRILDETCMVKFETVKQVLELPFKEILPMDNEVCGSEDESSGESSDGEVEIDQHVVNMSLMNTPSHGCLGDWEKFTKGIGSRLMQRMGYIVGTGLGKRSDGIIDPVTAVVLPPGKSLDHCMNLRENHGGDKNLFSVERKMKIQQRKQEMRNRKAYEKEQNKKDVFKFLNTTLTNKPGTSSMVYNKSQHRQDIKKETCRNLSVECFKTDENIRKTERDINILEESLSRHKDSNSLMHKNLKHKLNTTLHTLSDLKNQAQNIKNEQDNRRDKKKLTIF